MPFSVSEFAGLKTYICLFVKKDLAKCPAKKASFFLQSTAAFFLTMGGELIYDFLNLLDALTKQLLQFNYT